MKAKYLIDKAKASTSNKAPSSSSTIANVNSAPNTHLVKSNISNGSDRRAIWHTEEDELILLIKVASLYLMPGERCIPFKLISDILFELVPRKLSADKSVSSIGRRVKVLMKLKMNRLFVMNKYELCRQDKWLENKYGEAKSLLKRNIIDKECVDLYIRFINDVNERHMKKKKYNELEATTTFANDGSTASYCIEEGENDLQLPSTMEEFKKKYKIINSSKDLLFKSQSSYFQQPTTDYEITCNTVHSAIHVRLFSNSKKLKNF
jgi:hypothetical protein